MSVICCKSCKKSDYVKNGFVRGLQRYKCKFCNCNSTNTLQRSKPQGLKALAVLLYSMCNASQGMIAKLLNVSHVSVYRWSRKEAEKLEDPQGKEAQIVEIDEMWHFVNGKKTRVGSGKLMTLFVGRLLPGRVVHVMIEH